jgi:tetratricopeptide (TPR) repeat protein
MKTRNQPAIRAMSYIRAVCILILTACTLRGPAAALLTSDSSGSYNDSGLSRLLEARALTEQDKDAAAVALLEPLVQNKSGGLDDAHRGIAWNILGTAYQNMGHYEIARRCYESAIDLLKSLPFPNNAYIAALDNLGALEGLLNHLDAAISLRMKARKLYVKRSDYAGLARTDSNLAVIALSQNKQRHAHHLLINALNEAQRATNLGEGDRAEIYAVQGNFAAHDLDFAGAIKAYTLSIGLWRNAGGREASITAWEYALRGDAWRMKGNLQEATKDFQTAFAILESSDARATPVYFQIQLLDAKLLSAAGDKAMAARLESAAKESLQKIQQAAAWSVSADAFQ